MSLARGISLPLIVGVLIAGCATTKAGQGSAGGGSGSRRVLSPNADPVLNSAMTGAAIGALGGPIGLGVGAFLGYIHGLFKQKRMEEEAHTEVTRQEEIDKELERQIEAQRNGVTQNGMRGSTGLVLIKDHLAPESETAATSPPTTPPGAGKGLATATDNLASSAPPKLPTAGKTEALPTEMTKAAQTHTNGRSEEAEAHEALEKQIAAARARQRKLREALEATTATPDTAHVASRPASEPPPTIDQEGFRLVHAGRRLVRKERDVDGDGKPDIVRHYDETGELIRQEEDSRLDGKPDAWTFFEEGRPVRKESDTNGNGKVDLWAFYDETGNLGRTEADTDHDAHRDRVILYEEGEMVEEQRYSLGLKPPRLIVTYANGQRRRKEEDTDEDGRIDRVTEYDGAGHVTTVSRNPVGAGTFALVATYQPKTGKILQEEEDLNGDGSIDVISHYAEGRLVRREFFDLPEVASLSPNLALPQGPAKSETP